MKNRLRFLAAFVLATLGSRDIGAQTNSLSIPSDVRFLNLTSKPTEGTFEVRSGRIFAQAAGGEFKPWPLAELKSEKTIAYDGKAVSIMGAPAVILSKDNENIPSALVNTKATLRAARQSGRVIFVQEIRTSDEGLVTTTFIVSQQTPEKLSELGRFSFLENTFNQYLSEIWPVNSDTLSIATRSSRFPFYNTLFLFDMRRGQVVGMREFSSLQYLPSINAFWMAQPVVNSDNIEEMLADAKRKAAVFRIFKDGHIADDWKPVYGIDGSVIKSADGR